MSAAVTAGAIIIAAILGLLVVPEVRQWWIMRWLSLKLAWTRTHMGIGRYSEALLLLEDIAGQLEGMIGCDVLKGFVQHDLSQACMAVGDFEGAERSGRKSLGVYIGLLRNPQTRGGGESAAKLGIARVYAQLQQLFFCKGEMPEMHQYYDLAFESMKDVFAYRPDHYGLQKITHHLLEEYAIFGSSTLAEDDLDKLCKNSYAYADSVESWWKRLPWRRRDAIVGKGWSRAGALFAQGDYYTARAMRSATEEQRMHLVQEAAKAYRKVSRIIWLSGLSSLMLIPSRHIFEGHLRWRWYAGFPPNMDGCNRARKHLQWKRERTGPEKVTYFAFHHFLCTIFLGDLARLETWEDDSKEKARAYYTQAYDFACASPRSRAPMLVGLAEKRIEELAD